MTSARKITDTTTDRRQLSDDKRKFIRRVILDLFAAGPFQQVGIRDICLKAGVTPKTISSKDSKATSGAARTRAAADTPVGGGAGR